MTTLTENPLALGAHPWIVGHRGAAGSALENSLAAIRAGVEEGADMIELDVQLTSDGVLVVCHDWDLRRLAGRSEIIERTLLGQLLEIELASPLDDHTAPIATLEEALEVVPASLPVNLELKRRFHEPNAFASLLDSVVVLDRPLLVSSFDWNLLAVLRRRLRALPLAPIGRYKPGALLAAADELAAFSVHAHRELASEILTSDRLLERPLLAYTVNDGDEARRLVQLGAAGIFTDTPARLRHAVADDA